MINVLVLGAGMVGSAIAGDLNERFSVTSADSDPTKLNKLKYLNNIRTVQLDVNNRVELDRLISQSDITVNAVPGFLGFRILENIVEAGKNIVDISFFAEDAFLLDNLAVKKNITAIVDCGVAPGLSNIILGYHFYKDKVKSFTCYVGGLPYERTYPFQYKVPFSPSDVIEEYTRPARIKENGNINVKPALSEPELLEFRNIGTLEAFNSDGLRSLLKTIDIPDMKEKTLRYPGHRDAVLLLKNTGLLSPEEVEINGIKIKPVDLTSKLLFDLWKLEDTDDEFTVMKIEIETNEKKIIYDLFCERNKESGLSSMAMSTGFTCTAAVNLLAEGKISRKGICPPEYIGQDEDNYKYILEYLRERGVTVEKTEV